MQTSRTDPDADLAHKGAWVGETYKVLVMRDVRIVLEDSMTSVYYIIILNIQS